MARLGFAEYTAYVRQILSGWQFWGADFKVGDTSRADVEALLARYIALNEEIDRKLMQLEVQRAEREEMAKEIEQLGSRVRFTVLTFFAPRSPQVEAIPIFAKNRVGAPSKKRLAQIATAKNKREARENAAREALKAELRAELEAEQKKARLD